MEGVESYDGKGTIVRLACLNDDAQGQQLEVVWELETRQRNPGQRGTAVYWATWVRLSEILQRLSPYTSLELRHYNESQSLSIAVPLWN
jgi:hypothetical protein